LIPILNKRAPRKRLSWWNMKMEKLKKLRNKLKNIKNHERKKKYLIDVYQYHTPLKI
jgi:hypothetical protein